MTRPSQSWRRDPRDETALAGLNRSTSASLAQNCNPSSERRWDPADGQVRTWPELHAQYSEDYSADEIDQYWQTFCYPTSGPIRSEDAISTSDGTSSDVETDVFCAYATYTGDKNERRVDPEDGCQYTWNELRAQYGRDFRPEELSDYWDHNMVRRVSPWLRRTPSSLQAQVPWTPCQSAESPMQHDLQTSIRSATSDLEEHVLGTRQLADHKFSGIMFDVHCKVTGPPIKQVEIRAVQIQGDLGDISIYCTPGGHEGKHEMPREWTLIAEAHLPPSPDNFASVPFEVRVVLKPGDSIGLFVHSRLVRDTAIAYANQSGPITCEDLQLKVLPGRAHLSHVPFGPNGLPGAPLLHPQGWQQHRQFVGTIAYDVSYLIWTLHAQVNSRFPGKFRETVSLLIYAHRQRNGPIRLLPLESLCLVLSMCSWDWFGA